MPVRRPCRHGDRAEGAGGRRVPGGRASGEGAAEDVRQRAAVHGGRHPARGVQRTADLVRCPAVAVLHVHRGQRRLDPGQESRLPSRHLPRRVRAAMGGPAVARHDQAGAEGTGRAARRTVGWRTRRLSRLAQVRREGAGRTTLGRGPPLGRHPLLDPALHRRAGRRLPDRHGGRGPRTAARSPVEVQGAEAAKGSGGRTVRIPKVRLAPQKPKQPAPADPATAPAGTTQTTTLPWFTPDTGPTGPERPEAGQLSAPHDNSPTTKGNT